MTAVKPPNAKQRLKNRLWLAQKGICYLCGRLMNRTMLGHPHFATVDHVVPRSAGGCGAKNKKLACRECNELKVDKMLEEHAPDIHAQLNGPQLKPWYWPEDQPISKDGVHEFTKGDPIC